MSSGEAVRAERSEQKVAQRRLWQGDKVRDAWIVNRIKMMHH